MMSPKMQEDHHRYEAGIGQRSDNTNRVITPREMELNISEVYVHSALHLK